MTKPILCLDFDGVIHSYTSGWKGADVIPDPPVLGAIEFIRSALERFDVQIYSSRSGQPGGINAMQQWLYEHSDDMRLCEAVGWPDEKPPAMVTIDDRAITFTGEWPAIESLLDFQPWNKKPKLGATGEYPRGKFSADDEGALMTSIGTRDKTVIVNFGKPVAWIGMPKAEALVFAETIRLYAETL